MRYVNQKKAMLLLAAMLVGAGCSNNAATTTPAAEGDASQKEYTIKWVYPGSVQKDEALVEAEINKYLKDKLNAKVDLAPLDWGVWNDKMPVMIASGEAFDIMFTASWSQFSSNVAKGAFVELNELIDKHAPKTKGLLNPAFLEGSKVNGKNYGLPANKELAASYGALLNKNLVEKYKLDIKTIKKWEDLEPWFEQIKKNEPSITPFYIESISGPFWATPRDTIGDEFTPGIYKGGQVVNEMELPETKAMFEMTHRWMKAGYVNKDAANAKDRKEKLKAGTIFAYPEQLKPGKDAEVSLDVGVPYVQVELTKPIITTQFTTGSMMAISRTSKDPVRSMKLLELVNSDPYLNNLVNFGIEGKHFVKKSDKVIDFPAGIDGKSTTYAPNAGWMFGNQFLNYLWTNEDPQKWEKFKKFNESADKSEILGFNFDSEPVKNEVAAVKNVNSEFLIGLVSGTQDPAVTLPKYLEKLKAAGGDKIIAEKKKQLEAWKKNVKK